jgi:hypothetical protein
MTKLQNYPFSFFSCFAKAVSTAFSTVSLSSATSALRICLSGLDSPPIPAYTIKMSSQDTIATMIKVEQLAYFKDKLKYSYKETSSLFDQYHIWEFIDEAFEGLHVQGPIATYDDITAYINNIGGSL